MSHVVTIATEVRDVQAARAACRKLALVEPEQRTARLYSGEVSGLVVQLPGWRYPVVADVASGKVRFDNFGGRWGEQRELDRFLQRYAVEKARIEAHRKGLAVTEQALTDGSIKLLIQVQGGAVG